MEIWQISIFFSFILLAHCLTSTSSATTTKPFFSFGDSFLDAGNNNYITASLITKSNFNPYGITFFHYPTGRFSDGRLINDFLAEDAHLPLIPPYLQPGQSEFYNGSNFASGGAGALVETFEGQVIDLHTQLTNFKKVEEWLISELGEEGARDSLSRTVYMFSVGTNDYLTLFLGINLPSLITYTQSQYVDMVIGNITSVVTEIYKSGGRKFAFLNVPPIGCMPQLRIETLDGSCQSLSLSYTKQHNEALLQALAQLERKLPGFKYSLYDFYTAIQQRIDNPPSYGYTEGNTACCGTGPFRGLFTCGGRLIIEYELCQDIDDHVFWDSIHFTERVHRQIAEDMWRDEKSNLFHGSYTIKDLFHLP